MRASSLLLGFSLTVVALTGCLEPSEPEDILDPEPPAVRSVLQGALEAVGLDLPTFQVSTLVPHFGGGEPSVWAGVQGEMLVTFPGCERQGPTFLQSNQCHVGPAYRSLDGGKTWKRLNDAAGRLGKHAGANGDAEIASDAAGNLYAANLGNNIIPVDGLRADSTKWEYLENVVPDRHWADRQWMTAGAPDEVAVAWMGGEGDARQVAVTSSVDGGKKWTEVVYVGEGIGWVGPIVHEPNGTALYIPFTEPEPNLPQVNGLVSIITQTTFRLLLAKGAWGSEAWDVIDTGVRVTNPYTGIQWSGTLMVPTVDVTGDGTLVYAWSEPVAAAGPVGEVGAVVKFIASKDAGKTWSAPVRVNEGTSAIMPWVAAGAGDRFAVAYYESPLPVDHSYGGRWDVRVTVVDGAGDANPKMVHRTVEEAVHTGGVCTRGGVCLATGSDRTLLDFFEMDVTRDGHLLLAYPKNTHVPVPNGVGLNTLELRVAIQTGGTPLLVPPPAAQD